MFVLPVLIFPLVFGLAIYRLYRIPQMLLRGELQFPVKRRRWMLVAVTLAYVLLMSYTTALCAALVRAFVLAEHQLAAYMPLAVYIAAYPVVYVGVAWVFFYGLKRV